MSEQDAAAPASPPEGWYPDPQNAELERYWDGNAWTEQTQKKDGKVNDPGDLPAPTPTLSTAEPSTVPTDDEDTAAKRASAEEAAIQARINAAIAKAVNEERARAASVPAGDANLVAAAARREDDRLIAERRAAPFYCPGCGKPSKVEVPCVGTRAAPHPSIEVVPTDELAEDADPSGHTPAPATVV